MAAAEADMSLSHKVQRSQPHQLTPPPKQVQMKGEASLESNPVNVSPTTATYSSHSESPITDLTELQEDANLAS